MTGRTVQMLVIAALVSGIVVTSFSLVATTHESRQLFRELQALEREQDRLQDDWSALVLEVGTLEGHAEIDAFVRRELGMSEPGDRIRFVGVSP